MKTALMSELKHISSQSVEKRNGGSHVFVVETRSLKISKEFYLVCEPVFFASTLVKAEDWMLDQNPGFDERYYYCIYSSILDSDHDFVLIGFYDILGQKSTLDRCLQTVLPQPPSTLDSA